MSIEVWFGKREFDYSHEEKAAEEAIKALESFYTSSRDFCFLVLNFHCKGEDFDALILKKDAILIIDFKDCDKSIVGSVNGNWHVKGDSRAILNEGRRNPFQQVKAYRYALMEYMDENRASFLPAQKASQASFEHISAAVCITPSMHSESEIDVDLGKERWFRVVGMPDLADLVRRERSPKISLGKTELRKFIKDVLHCELYTPENTEAPSEVQSPPVQSPRKEKKMPYTAEISRVNPSCFLFLIDQSQSMANRFGGSEAQTSKADELANAINRLLSNLIIKCSKDMEVRRYFQVGIIGYGASVGPALGGGLAGQELVWIDDIYNHPIRIEERSRKVSDGAGGLVETSVKFPVWFESVAAGMTPMCQAFSQAHTILQDWISRHPSSYPPVVINITDGESTDGDPSTMAEAIKATETEDGNVLLYNLHLTSHRAPTVHFPDTEESLPEQYACLLFRMSSQLPEHLIGMARELGYQVSDSARGFVFNAGVEDVISFLEIGTRPANMR
jgi:hypothetical protein